MAKDPASEFASEQAAAAVHGDGTTAAPPAPAAREDFFGQPRGLSTLFFTELWERFSYYGMRALLVLFMTAAATGVANPGLGFSAGQAGAVYGLYTFFVYVLALPGGWVADNLWGQRRSVFVGGCIIALGHFTMAGPLIGLPDAPTFYLGLALIAIGTGLLKPNVSVMVGELYPEGGARRDAGFSIFYMGINLGAILGPTLCGILGEGYNWHLGFSLAGFGMVLGLISYKIGERYLGEAGTFTADVDAPVLARRTRNFYLAVAAAAALVVVVGFLMSTGLLPITLEELARSLGVVAVIVTLCFFVYIIFFGGHTEREKKQLGVILWLFVLAALFWSGFEQAGSTLNIFADEQTDRLFGPYGWLEAIGAFVPALLVALPLGYVCYRIFRRDDLWWLGKAGVAALSVLIVGFIYYVSVQVTDLWELPASMLQNINPLFIVLLAPVFGWLWTWLAARETNPSIPVKFGLGLLGLAKGFFVISWGAVQAGADPASPAWLVVMYFLFTCGELCLSPVGLSSMTKLAPPSRVSQMMGIWFVASALGSLFAGLAAGRLEGLPAGALFQNVGFIVGGAGLVALLASPFVKRLMGDVE